MLLIDMSFIKRGTLRTVFTQTNHRIVAFTKSSDFPMSSVERKVKVLDTTTGKITERSVKSLFEKPLRPFVKDKTLEGKDVLALANAYKFAELKETVIRVKDICFYFTNKGFLLLYEHNIYYKESLRPDYEEIAGFPGAARAVRGGAAVRAGRLVHGKDAVKTEHRGGTRGRPSFFFPPLALPRGICYNHITVFPIHFVRCFLCMSLNVNIISTAHRARWAAM